LTFPAVGKRKERGGGRASVGEGASPATARQWFWSSGVRFLSLIKGGRGEEKKGAPLRGPKSYHWGSQVTKGKKAARTEQKRERQLLAQSSLQIALRIEGGKTGRAGSLSDPRFLSKVMRGKKGKRAKEWNWLFCSLKSQMAMTSIYLLSDALRVSGGGEKKEKGEGGGKGGGRKKRGTQAATAAKTTTQSSYLAPVLAIDSIYYDVLKERKRKKKRKKKRNQ